MQATRLSRVTVCPDPSVACQHCKIQRISQHKGVSVHHPGVRPPPPLIYAICSLIRVGSVRTGRCTTSARSLESFRRIWSRCTFPKYSKVWPIYTTRVLYTAISKAPTFSPTRMDASSSPILALPVRRQPRARRSMIMLSEALTGVCIILSACTFVCP